MTYLSNIANQFNELTAYFDTIMPPKEGRLIDKTKEALREAYECGEQGLPYPQHYEPRGVQQH